MEVAILAPLSTLEAIEVVFVVRDFSCDFRRPPFNLAAMRCDDEDIARPTIAADAECVRRFAQAEHFEIYVSVASHYIRPAVLQS